MDTRLQEVETQKQEALNQSNTQFGSMLENNQNLYDQQLNYADQFEQIQNETLDKQLEFNTGIIEQNKEQAAQTKQTESNMALNDYTAFTNPYGTQAENMAASGLLSSGVSETAKLGGFNTYQNRLSAANTTYQNAITAFDNDIAAARLANDATKAENALAKLQIQLDALNTFTNTENTLLQNQLSNNQALESQYQGQYNTVYDQLQQEQATAEAIRQYEEQFAYQKEQDALSQSNYERELAKVQQSDEKNYPYIDNNQYDVNTQWYQGDFNPDVQYGTFDNGYQPNNINGDKLKKSGGTVKDYLGSNIMNSTGTTTLDDQNVWQDSNGNSYVWDGSANRYIKISSGSSREF